MEIQNVVIAVFTKVNRPFSEDIILGNFETFRIILRVTFLITIEL